MNLWGRIIYRMGVRGGLVYWLGFMIKMVGNWGWQFLGRNWSIWMGDRGGLRE